VRVKEFDTISKKCDSSQFCFHAHSSCSFSSSESAYKRKC